MKSVPAIALVLQILLWTLEGFKLWIPFAPSLREYSPIILGLISILSHLYAQYTNPDGTSARAPWRDDDE